MLPATTELNCAATTVRIVVFEVANKLSMSPGPPTATPIGKPSVAMSDFNATTLLEELDELELTELTELLDTLLDELLATLLEEELLLDAMLELLLEVIGGVPLEPPPPHAVNNKVAASNMPAPAHFVYCIIILGSE
jgi:hypothetical protein